MFYVHDQGLSECLELANMVGRAFKGATEE